MVRFSNCTCSYRPFSLVSISLTGSSSRAKMCTAAFDAFFGSCSGDFDSAFAAVSSFSAAEFSFSRCLPCRPFGEGFHIEQSSLQRISQLFRSVSTFHPFLPALYALYSIVLPICVADEIPVLNRRCILNQSGAALSKAAKAMVIERIETETHPRNASPTSPNCSFSSTSFGAVKSLFFLDEIALIFGQRCRSNRHAMISKWELGTVLSLSVKMPLLGLVLSCQVNGNPHHSHNPSGLFCSKKNPPHIRG